MRSRKRTNAAVASPAGQTGRQWRPRVVNTSGDVAEAIYGLILATSVIAVSESYDSSDAGLIALSVLVTGIVFWLAHVYARLLARSISDRRALGRTEIREILRHDWPLVEVTVPLVVILALGGAGVVADRTAIVTAVVAAIVELAAAGAYAARTSGAGVRGMTVSAVIAVTFGCAVILLKALVH